MNAPARLNFTPNLRYYQSDLKDAIRAAWCRLGPRSQVIGVSPTGSGKGVLIGALVAEAQGAVCVMAHRQELIGQLSMSLARFNVRHRIIAPDPVVRAICAEHLTETGKCWFDPTARAGVASVQSLTPRRIQQESKWLTQVTELITDEAAHVLRDNIWGKAAALFPNARGLGLTATPCRSDGRGLGAHADGVYSEMVLGPHMRDLIDAGYICNYRVVCATTHIELQGVGIGVNGDYTLDRGKGKEAVRKSSIVGDVVATYKKWAHGKQCLVFASDIDTARDMAEDFNAHGVKAIMLDGTTPDAERRSAMKQFRNKEIQVVTSVNLFAEGLDIAGVDCVSLARPTMSFGLHAQQIGRALRLSIDPAHMKAWDTYTVEQRLAIIAASPKPRALVIDHAGNCLNPRLGLPDSRTTWTLDAEDRKSSGPSDVIPNRACLNPECLSPYLRSLPACPFCGTKPQPTPGRSGPEAVDGDLIEMDEALLEVLRGKVAKVAMPNDVFREQEHIRTLPAAWIGSNVKKHDAHRTAQSKLQNAMAWFGGEKRALGYSDSRLFREFFLVFGHDWLSVQAQDRETMEKVTGWIFDRLSVDTLSQMVDTCVN